MKMRNVYGRIIIYLFVLICLLSAQSAFSAENIIEKKELPLDASDDQVFNVNLARELPLSASDDRVIKGNIALEKELAEKEEELNGIFEKYKATLTPDLRVLFDESHLDWEDCIRDEKGAFKPSDRWTRANSKSEYENLYRKNLIYAVDFRRLQIENFAKKRIPAADNVASLEAEKEFILKELEEFNYRIIVWTPEQLRYRVTRSMRTWDRYYETSMMFFRVLAAHDPKKIIALEVELLRYRMEYMKTQREALLRVRFETEE